MIEAWCNGNTQLFGSCIVGSNPAASTNIGMAEMAELEDAQHSKCCFPKGSKGLIPFSAQQKTVIRLMACPDEVIQNGRHRVFEVSNVNFHRRRDNNQIQMKSTMTFLQ